MKLWQKDYKLNKEIEKFTVGNDFLLDKELVKYDVLGSIAHAMMLNKINIINKNELQKLKNILLEILELNKNEKFEIEQRDEDVHTAIENHLTQKLGNLGKKIHTARSRNDQVLVNLRLYSKEKLLKLKKTLIGLVSNIIDFAEKNKNIPIPGYTHTRKAMPSSVGLLFGAYAESLLDNFELIDTSYKLNNQNPLGSAAGYGINLDIDRGLTTKLLGFDKVQNNALYVQNSRGKIESTIVFSLSKIMEDLAKFSNDLILFSTDEFGYFTLPDKFTTGSSLMPHKKNPDVLELIRAKASAVQANLFQINSITSKLISGYNRDLQLTKEPLIDSFKTTLSSTNIFNLIINKLTVNKENCIKAFDNSIFATDQTIDSVKKGIPFREAYKKVAKNLTKIQKIDPITNIQSKKNIGATGNLGLNKLKLQLNKIKSNVSNQENDFKLIVKSLVG